MHVLAVHVLADARSAISACQSGRLRGSIVRAWSPVPVQVDRQLAVSARRDFPRSLLSRGSAAASRRCLAALLLPPLDQVRVSMGVGVYE